MPACRDYFKTHFERGDACKHNAWIIEQPSSNIRKTFVIYETLIPHKHGSNTSKVNEGKRRNEPCEDGKVRTNIKQYTF